MLHQQRPVSRCHAIPLSATAGVTRHTTLPTSSATSSAPSLSTTTPTGRPRALPSSSRKPVRISTGSPLGLPSSKPSLDQRLDCKSRRFAPLRYGWLQQQSRQVRNLDARLRDHGRAYGVVEAHEGICISDVEVAADQRHAEWRVEIAEEHRLRR